MPSSGKSILLQIRTMGHYMEWNATCCLVSINSSSESLADNTINWGMWLWPEVQRSSAELELELGQAINSFSYSTKSLQRGVLRCLDIHKRIYPYWLVGLVKVFHTADLLGFSHWHSRLSGFLRRFLKGETTLWAAVVRRKPPWRQRSECADWLETAEMATVARTTAGYRRSPKGRTSEWIFGLSCVIISEDVGCVSLWINWLN